MTANKTSKQLLNDLNADQTTQPADSLTQSLDIVPPLEAAAIEALPAELLSQSSVFAPQAVPGIERTGGNGNNVLRGTDGDDTLRGGRGNDRLIGFAGGDRLLGEQGNDRLFGSEGLDRLFGGNGNDRLEGEIGADTLRGGGGRDTLRGGGGLDLLNGNAGEDNLLGGNQQDTIRGGQGEDTLLGGRGNDVIVGGEGEDTLTGGPGGDRFVFESFSDRSDTINDFDEDRDRLDFSRLLTGSRYSSSDPLDDYVVIVNDEDERTIIRVDPDGDAERNTPFKTIVILEDIDFDDVRSRNFIF